MKSGRCIRTSTSVAATSISSSSIPITPLGAICRRRAAGTLARIESTAGQDWQRERDGYAPGGEQVSAQVSQVLSELMGNVEKLSLKVIPADTPARAAYARVGFEQTATFATLMF